MDSTERAVDEEDETKLETRNQTEKEMTLKSFWDVFRANLSTVWSYVSDLSPTVFKSDQCSCSTLQESKKQPISYLMSNKIPFPGFFVLWFPSTIFVSKAVFSRFQLCFDLKCSFRRRALSGIWKRSCSIENSKCHNKKTLFSYIELCFVLEISFQRHTHREFSMGHWNENSNVQDALQKYVDLRQFPGCSSRVVSGVLPEWLGSFVLF